MNGAFASAVLAFGLALVYGATGATGYGSIQRSLAAGDPRNAMLLVALVLVATGFGFKIAAVPFHGWAPDVYEGAPTPVTAFMSVGIKAGAFAGFLRIVALALIPASQGWSDVLIILAVLTMVVGNVLALPQRNLKRLLAYSSIAHAGYLLLGLVALGRSHDTTGASAVLFYLAAYTFMNLGAFGVLVLIRNRRAFAYTLDELAGMGRSMPLTAFAMTLFMLSLTGIPPLAGFWGKFYLFTAVIDAHLTWLAVVAVVMSAVSAFYYLRIVWYLYFREAEPAAEEPELLPPTAASPARRPSRCSACSRWACTRRRSSPRRREPCASSSRPEGRAQAAACRSRRRRFWPGSRAAGAGGDLVIVRTATACACPATTCCQRWQQARCRVRLASSPAG